MAGRYRRSLGDALRGERRAYGFTLVVWGTGAILLATKGRPGVASVVAYVGGYLVVMALTILATAGGVESTLPKGDELRPALSSLHFPSVAAAIAAAAGIAQPISSRPIAYLLAAVVACSVFQAVLGLELALLARRDGD